MNAELIKYLDQEGKIKVYPSKQKKKEIILFYLALKFEYNRIYTEKEVNEIIDNYHSFNDYFLLRRELIDHRLLMRTRNGAKYWKSDLLTECFETKKLLIRNSILEDESDFIEIGECCAYLTNYTGDKRDKYQYHMMLKEGDLPPNGQKEFYQCKTIVEKCSQKIIGYFDLYRGYPNSDTLWISIFQIHKDYQQEGFGQEVIQDLIDELKNCQFKKISLGVHLKNWQGLRFWVKNGFIKINGIYGDREYKDDHYSVIVLERDL